jgi:hypothetical protein
MVARSCLKRKALGVPGRVGAAVRAFSPELPPAALPLLTFLACPLAMLRGMQVLKAAQRPSPRGRGHERFS